MEVSVQLGGGAIAMVLGFLLRAYHRGKIRRPDIDRDIDITPVRAEPDPPESSEADLNERELRTLIQDVLRHHCPVEQEKMTKELTGAIRDAVTEQTRDLVQWRGAVDERLTHANGSDQDLHKRMDRLEDNMNKALSDLRGLIIQAIQRGSGIGGNGP